MTCKWYGNVGPHRDYYDYPYFISFEELYTVIWEVELEPLLPPFDLTLVLPGSVPGSLSAVSLWSYCFCELYGEASLDE